MTEEAIEGPALFVPAVVQRALLAPRNRESLARLANVVCGR